MAPQEAGAADTGCRSVPYTAVLYAMSLCMANVCRHGLLNRATCFSVRSGYRGDRQSHLQQSGRPEPCSRRSGQAHQGLAEGVVHRLSVQVLHCQLQVHCDSCPWLEKTIKRIGTLALNFLEDKGFWGVFFLLGGRFFCRQPCSHPMGWQRQVTCKVHLVGRIAF